MKFKELPEGYYFIHAVRDVVSVELLKSPETAPRYLTETSETTRVVHDGRKYLRGGELLDEKEIKFTTYDEMRKGRKARGASYGHVKRRLMANEPLKGKTLELALELVTPAGPVRKDADSDLMNSIARKLNAGHPLNDYEMHIMVDVVLLHARLG